MYLLESMPLGLPRFLKDEGFGLTSFFVFVHHDSHLELAKGLVDNTEILRLRLRITVGCFSYNRPEPTDIGLAKKKRFC